MFFTADRVSLLQLINLTQWIFFYEIKLVSWLKGIIVVNWAFIAVKHCTTISKRASWYFSVSLNLWTNRSGEKIFPILLLKYNWYICFTEMSSILLPIIGKGGVGWLYNSFNMKVIEHWLKLNGSWEAKQTQRSRIQLK